MPNAAEIGCRQFCIYVAQRYDASYDDAICDWNCIGATFRYFGRNIHPPTTTTAANSSKDSTPAATPNYQLCAFLNSIIESVYRKDAHSPFFVDGIDILKRIGGGTQIDCVAL